MEELRTRDALKQFANELETLASKYAKNDKEVALFCRAINKVIGKAKAGKKLYSEDVISGRPWFDEGELRKYSDLESSFAKLMILIRSGSLDEYERTIR